MREQKIDPVYTAAFSVHRGEFSEIACGQLLMPSSRLLSCGTLKQVFDSVGEGVSQYGIIPAENTDGELVTESFDLLSEHVKLSIISETVCRNEPSGNIEASARFLMIAEKGTPWPPALWKNQRKTTIVFKIWHSPGSLMQALRHFSERAINISKIESRQVRGSPYVYKIHLDFVTDIRDEKKVAEALKELEGGCLSMQILGTYPPVEEHIARALGATEQ